MLECKFSHMLFVCQIFCQIDSMFQESNFEVLIPASDMLSFYTSILGLFLVLIFTQLSQSDLFLFLFCFQEGCIRRQQIACLAPIECLSGVQHFIQYRELPYCEISNRKTTDKMHCFYSKLIASVKCSSLLSTGYFCRYGK